MRDTAVRRWVAIVFAAGLVTAACGAEQTGGTYLGVGIVREVDAAKGEVVIEHEDIPGLMKGMKMRFQASPSVLQGVQPGQQVHFTLVHEEGGPYEITEIQAHGD